MHYRKLLGVPLVGAGVVIILIWAAGHNAERSGSIVPEQVQRSSPEAFEGGPKVTAIPKFHVFRQKLGYPVPLVVSNDTTDQQLESLLWYIRENVRAKRFQDLGISDATSLEIGRPRDYDSGMIFIFRSERCAAEDFLDEFSGTGPCGYGEHHAAQYDWDRAMDNGVIVGKRLIF